MSTAKQNTIANTNRRSVQCFLAIFGIGTAFASANAADKPPITSLIFRPSMNVVLSTSDVPKIKEFYGKVLALNPMSPLMLPGNLEMTRYQVGTSEIKFLHNPKPLPRQTGPIKDALGIRSLTFYFPNQAELTARFKENNQKTPVFSAHPNQLGQRAFVNDPDGNVIELVALPSDASKEDLRRLDIGLTVSNIEKARAFYGGFVGIKPLDTVEDPTLGQKVHAYRHGNTTVKFWSFDKKLPNHTGRWQDAYGIRYIQYIVKDLDAVNARAKAENVRIHTPIFPLGKLARIMFLADQDGIINEFVGFPKRSSE